MGTGDFGTRGAEKVLMGTGAGKAPGKGSALEANMGSAVSHLERDFKHGGGARMDDRDRGAYRSAASAISEMKMGKMKDSKDGTMEK